MTLKLTKRQNEELYKLFNFIISDSAKDIPGSLMKDLMRPIYIKLLKRNMEQLTGNKGWNLTLTTIEAKAYYTFFQSLDISEKWEWASVIVSQHLTEIEHELKNLKTK